MEIATEADEKAEDLQDEWTIFYAKYAYSVRPKTIFMISIRHAPLTNTAISIMLLGPGECNQLKMDIWP